MELLILLAESGGKVVTRQEIAERLWGKDVFVDTEHGVNTAVRKIRTVLRDDPEHPRFVQTVVGKGYRFVAEVNPPSATAPVESNERKVFHGWQLKIAIWILLGGFSVLALTFVPRLRTRAESGKLLAVPFTSLPGQEMAPTFSPDGSQIAFAWNGDPAIGSKGFDLYVKVIGSENLLRLTNHASDWLRPAWSPDGKEIAFHRVSEADTGLYVVPALGGPERHLRTTHATSRTPASISWSADGKWIAYPDLPDFPGHFQLNLLSMETLENKVIPHAGECGEELIPAFSHDSKRLAYICLPASGGFGVYLVNPWSGAPAPQKISQFSGWPWGLAWDGNDRRLILSRFQEGLGPELDALSRDGSWQKLSVGNNSEWPTISAKGDKLAYEGWGPTNVNIWRRDLFHPEAPAVKLIYSTRREETPRYSPDGRHIAFASSRSGNYEMWMSDADGKEIIQLSKLGNPLTGSPNWSPDGRKIAFDSGQFGDARIYIVDVDEQIPRQLVTTVEKTSVPSWSHDGKWIYFIGDGNEAGGVIYRCPASGGQAEVISNERGYGPVESLDGGRVYLARFFAGNTDLQAVSLKGRQTTSLPGLPPLRFSTDWAVAPEGIYFIPAISGKAIRYYDFATGKVREVFKSNEQFDIGLSVSPDGRWLLYTQVAEQGADIMLVEHFR